MRRKPTAARRHRKPHVLIQPLSKAHLKEPAWKQIARLRLACAWEGEEDVLYEYLGSRDASSSGPGRRIAR